ncbi:hypothetical protein OK016_05810 [Vibrio chagasii]|nr:hypothetical protein [Vibrio chagasii]
MPSSELLWVSWLSVLKLYLSLMQPISQVISDYIARCGLTVYIDAIGRRLTLLNAKVRCAWPMPEHDWPAMDLIASLVEHLGYFWLSPYLTALNLKGLANVSIEQALSAYLGWPRIKRLTSGCANTCPTPTGSADPGYQHQSEPDLGSNARGLW